MIALCGSGVRLHIGGREGGGGGVLRLMACCHEGMAQRGGHAEARVELFRRTQGEWQGVVQEAAAAGARRRER